MLPELLAEIVELYALAPADAYVVRDGRGERVDDNGRRWPHYDHVANTLATGPVRSTAGGPVISGSANPPVPANLDLVDLHAPARVPNPTAAGRAWWRDQVGALSVPTTLDSWVRYWRESLFTDHHLPVPTVVELVGWLRNRVDIACDRHPAVDEFAAELRSLRGTLLSALGRAFRPGDPVGTCPVMVGDTERCGTALYADPYLDWVACGRCGSRWDRRTGGWMVLAAAQEDARTEAEQAEPEEADSA